MLGHSHNTALQTISNLLNFPASKTKRLQAQLTKNPANDCSYLQIPHTCTSGVGRHNTRYIQIYNETCVKTILNSRPCRKRIKCKNKLCEMRRHIQQRRSDNSMWRCKDVSRDPKLPTQLGLAARLSSKRFVMALRTFSSPSRWPEYSPMLALAKDTGDAKSTQPSGAPCCPSGSADGRMTALERYTRRRFYGGSFGSSGVAASMRCVAGLGVKAE